MEKQIMEIPIEIKFVSEELKKKGFKAYLVGGCVRDILRNVQPQDWDIATNANPEEIGQIFLRSFSDNKFGTVKVLISQEQLDVSIDSNDSKGLKEKFREIEITPFRIEEKYTDKRHPDEIKWAETIEEDLKRRDFTINAMAIELKSHIPNSKSLTRPNFAEGKNCGGQANPKSQISNFKRVSDFGFQISNLRIIDPFNGRKDLQNKIIRAVGDAEERFNEDALRLIRALRFTVCLEPKIWQIEEKTAEAIKTNSELLQFISKERIRDELIKITNSVNAARGIEMLRRYQLLRYIIPELEEGFGTEQNKHHIYQVYQHNLLSLNYASQRKFSLAVKLAALLHDIAKPRVKAGQGPESTFYNHEIMGAEMTYQILKRLKFPKKETEKITKLVRYHLFYYNVDEVSESSVRRLLRKVGWEDISELLEVRQADRIGSGVPKAEPYKLRHLKYVFEKVSQDPISPKMLKVNGNDVMRILNIPAGPKIGQILFCLLAEVLADPKTNTKEFLEAKIELFKKMPDADLEKMNQKAHQEIEKIEIKRDEMTKTKYWIT